MPQLDEKCNAIWRHYVFFGRIYSYRLLLLSCAMIVAGALLVGAHGVGAQGQPHRRLSETVLSNNIPLVIHATHEAGIKMGGIGAVLDGLLGARRYNERVERSILAGPLFGGDALQMERLNSPRNHLQIHYSSLHGIFDGIDEPTQQALRMVERTYQVALLYGARRFGDAVHEILLVDASNPDMAHVSTFCYFLWEHYGIDSQRYSHDDEYNLYLSIAQPLFAGLKALGVDAGLSPHERVIIAHEWLGMPVIFAAQMNEPEQWRTVFYAHEMATARLLVENHSGHDTRFYNALLRAQDSHLPLETVFGDQSHYFKHAIIQQAARCNTIFAVGDLVMEELRFLGGPFTDCTIDLVYNGIDATEVCVEDRLDSKRRLQEYCRTLLGFSPDYVFTHVARLVLSKGLWRDVRVMAHLERILRSSGKTAVLFALSTSQPAGRQPAWVRGWEADYSWPVGHRADNGDLIGAEAPFFFEDVEPFNRSARNGRIVLINQFGWNRERCGARMPADMEFMDIRRGSDLEFGQSIYEPFGIAQVEPINSGAISCLSNVCGCIGFVKRVAKNLGQQGVLSADILGNAEGLPYAGGMPAVPGFRPDDGGNWGRGDPCGCPGQAQTPTLLVVADYIRLPERYAPDSAQDALTINQEMRDRIEGRTASATARRVFKQLVTSREQMAEQIRIGSALAQGMSWNVVVESFFLPGLKKACG